MDLKTIRMNAARPALFAALILIGVSSSHVAHALRFGAICNTTYLPGPSSLPPDQRVPAPQVAGQNACNTFLKNMSSSVAWVFNWNTMSGEIHMLEQSWESKFWNNIENVDIVFITGHNAANTTRGISFSGAHWQEFASSKDMHLGDTDVGRGLSVLADQGCYTLTPKATVVDKNGNNTEPGYPGVIYEFPVAEDLGPRWSNAFDGGLRLITSTWHEMPTDRGDVLGGNYSTYLNRGWTFENAWKQAAFDQSPTAAPAATATGVDGPTCYNRLRAMTLSNFTTSAIPRLTAGMWHVTCTDAWQN